MRFRAVPCQRLSNFSHQPDPFAALPASPPSVARLPLQQHSISVAAALKMGEMQLCTIAITLQPCPPSLPAHPCHLIGITTAALVTKGKKQLWPAITTAQQPCPLFLPPHPPCHLPGITVAAVMTGKRKLCPAITTA